MPSIDELLDTEAARWRAQTDASYATATFTLEPPGRPATRRRVVWAASALGAAAVATAILLASLSGSSGNKGPALANSGPVHPEHSTSGTNSPAPVGPAPSAQCAAPVLSFRDAFRHRHFRPVPTRTRPVHRGDAVLIYGYFFVDTCNDTGQGTPIRPIPSVPLILRTSDGQRRVVLVAQPRGDLGKFVVRVRIPAHAAPGRAAITYGRHYGGTRLTVAEN